MNTDQEVIHHCFEEVAKADVDLAPAVYEKFTACAPQASQHISHMDDRMRGRMLDQIYGLLLGDADSDYLEFEARMHRGYGASADLYRGILTAVKAAAQEILAEAWSPETDAAWDRTIERILNDILRLEPAG